LDVLVLSGDEPFASRASSVARSWLFEPATLDGVARAAKIRFEVRFETPRDTSDEPRAGAAAAQTPAADSEAAAEPSGPPPPPLEVVIEGERAPLGKRLGRAEVRELPGAFGDPFRAIESMPGVTPIASGLPYFFVRGAPPGNVGYFFDDIRVPTLFHAAIGPSVIHPAFVDQVQLYAGPYPARYGRFTGGVVAATSEPPRGVFRGEASVRLVDAGAMVELPLFEGRGNLMLAGRYSYTAALISLISPELELSYWDYQGRAQYRLSPADTLTLFSFGTSDYAADDNGEAVIFDVAFNRTDLRWDHELEGRSHLRLATTLGVDRTIGDDEEFAVRDFMSGVRLNYDYDAAPTVLFRTGADVLRDSYSLRLGAAAEDELEEDFSERFPGRVDTKTGVFVDMIWDATPRLRLSPGLRADLYTSRQNDAAALSPRLLAEFRVSDSFRFLHGLGVAHQAPSFIIPVPGLQPELEDGLQRAIQSSAGVEWDVSDGLSASLTLYQSLLLNVNDALGLSRLDNGDRSIDEDSRALGSGRGLEFSLRRPLTRRLGGYLSYTLSESRRSVGRAEGPSTFDRRHVLGGALAYSLGSGWRAGLRGTFYTGIPVDVAYVEAAADPPRTRPFYRFDWRLEKRWDLAREGSFVSFVAEVLNTTLNKEVLNASCSAYVCRQEELGPITIPSLGVEAGF
jgi:hypothetical protein